MKKMYFWSALLIGSMLFVGCENQDPEPDPEPKKATQVEAVTAMGQYVQANSLFSNSFGIASRHTLDLSSAQNVRGYINNFTYPIVDVNPKDSVWPKTITIDYGPENISGNDMRLHRGKMTVVATGLYRTEGSELTVSFDNFYIDNYKLEGTQVIKNMGRNSSNKLIYNVKVLNGKLTSPQNITSTYVQNTTRTWIDGDTTLTNVLDDTYSIEGSQSGVSSDTIAYSLATVVGKPMVVNVGTKWPLSGTLNVTVNPFPQFQLVFEGDSAKVKFSELVEFPIPLQ